MDRCVEQLDADIRQEFMLEPERTLTNRLGLTVRPVDALASSRGDGGFCDGMSYLEDGIILYAPTPNSRRQNFTLAHELGHWLVDQDVRLFDWIADQAEPDVVLESVCDQIAQRLLLPDDVIDSVLGAEVVRARHVQALFDRSQASYQACAIAVSRRIRGLGAVVLIGKHDGVVQHASIRPDPDDGWPEVYPWRGQVLPEINGLRTLTSGGSFTRRITWRDSWDRTSDYYADVVADERKSIVVLAGQDVWCVEPSYVSPPREFDQRPMMRVHCCGREQTFRGYPCPTCREGFCPDCGDCRCTRGSKTEVMCTRCFVVKQPQLVVAGLCENCR